MKEHVLQINIILHKYFYWLGSKRDENSKPYALNSMMEMSGVEEGAVGWSVRIDGGGRGERGGAGSGPPSNFPGACMEE